MRNLCAFFIFLVFSSNLFGQNDDFNTYGSANVTASRLIGTWQINEALTNRLGKDLKHEEDKFTTISFLLDSTVVAQIPAEYEAFLAQKKVYLSGYLQSKQVYKNEKTPFVLIENEGNSHLLFFRPDYSDAESFNLFIAVSEDKKNDLLFTGGDFNNCPFMAWDRVE
jgi:hypothetical protein